MKTKKKILEQRFLLFVFSFFIMVVASFTVFSYVKHAIYDSVYYCTIANPVFENGFDLSKYPETFRGVLLPLLIQIFWIPFSKIGLDTVPQMWKIIVSVMVGFFFSYLLPEIFCDSKIRIKHYICTIILMILLLVFWGDFLQYPLADFPAAFAMVSAMALLIKIQSYEKVLPTILGGVGVGGLMYFAYNTRATYLYAIACGIVILIIMIIKEKKAKKLLCIIGIIIGMSVVSLPQIMVNYQYVHKYSPKVYSEQIKDYTSSLQKRQMIGGMMANKVEGYIGDLEEYPIQGILFNDPIGIEIMEREELEMGEDGVKTLVILFAKYPQDMIGIYTRHLICLMTPMYIQQYLTNAYTNKGFFISIIIIVWMIAALGIINRCNYHCNIWNLLFLFSAMLPCFMQIVATIETRHFITVHFVLYYFIVFMIDYRLLWKKIKPHIVPVGLICFIIYIFWISNIGMILSYNVIKPFMINDRYIEHEMPKDDGE